MLHVILNRLSILPFMVIAISILVFTIIQLPPGNFVEHYIDRLEASGTTVSQEEAEQLTRRYGLDKPMHEQYLLWVGSMLKGDFGYSFEAGRAVRDVVFERLPFTMIISFASMVFTLVVAFSIGTFIATRQYSASDYIASTIGFLGMATPNFMIALILMWFFYVFFNTSVGGLNSPEFENAPWNVARILDFMKHLIIPMIVVGTAGTAGSIRSLRANILDELSKPYVITAEAKGVPPRKRLWKYPLRIATIPFFSTVGWRIPSLVSGTTITAVVLSLPTIGPMMLSALRTQDMFLAGSMLLFLSFLTVIGTLISDIALAWLDPRIRYDR